MKWSQAKGDAAARLRQRKYALLRRFQIPADALPGSLALIHRRCGNPLLIAVSRHPDHFRVAEESMIDRSWSIESIPLLI